MKCNSDKFQDECEPAKRSAEFEDLEIAEDLQLLEVELERPKYRSGYKRYLKSPEHDLELFLDRLDNERRSRR